MEAHEAISRRKTIRNFQQREVPMHLVRKLLDAGLKAPSHDHMRAWHFVIIQDKAQRRALLEQTITPRSTEEAAEIVESWGMTNPIQREMYIDAIPKQFRMLLDAGCLILPCFRQETPLLEPGSLSSLNGFASIWCCIENILVAAAAEGIFGVTRIPSERERETIKRFLSVPTDYEIPCYLALGYPKAMAKRARQMEVSVDERIYVNVWGEHAS
jgi:nitroreductase